MHAISGGSDRTILTLIEIGNHKSSKRNSRSRRNIHVKKLTIIAVIAAVLSFPAAALADGTGASVQVGTLGLGVQLSQRFNSYFGARLQLNNYTYSYDATKSNVDYSLDLKLDSYGALLDWHPFAGSFRVSAGVYANNNEIDGLGKPSSGTYNINGVSYPSSQVGTLSAKIDFNSTVGYFGIGWGQAPEDTGLGFTADIGVLFQGNPNAALSASGPLASNSTFQQDLTQEQSQLQGDLNGYDTYPVVSFGISYVF